MNQITTPPGWHLDDGHLFALALGQQIVVPLKVARATSTVDGYACSAKTWRHLDFTTAWVDPGGTVFGRGPYLKVKTNDGESEHRVRCRLEVGMQWGGVRVVGLDARRAKLGGGSWMWCVTMERVAT